ncbi:MAG TPA: four helix bundle protein [Acidobacteriaceae bacterium]
MPKVIDFKDLLIWQKGMALARKVYDLTARLPAEEKFGLSSQMRRAAVSIPSNIAEGQVRRGTKEFVQFLAHASGSLAELETQLLLSVELGFVQRSEIAPLDTEVTEIQKMIAAIQRKLALRTLAGGE